MKNRSEECIYIALNLKFFDMKFNPFIENQFYVFFIKNFFFSIVDIMGQTCNLGNK